MAEVKNVSSEIQIKTGRIIYSVLSVLFFSFAFFFWAPTGGPLYALIAFALMAMGFNVWFFKTGLAANFLMLLMFLVLIGDPFLFPYYGWYRFYFVGPSWPILFLIVLFVLGKQQQE